MNEYYKKFVDINKLRLFNVDAYSLRGKNFFKNIFNYRKKILKTQKYRIQKSKNFKCNLCGSSNTEIFLSWKLNYKLLECKLCKSISPNIINHNETEFIDSIYNNNNYTKKAFLDIFKNYNYRKKKFGLERYNYTIKRLNLSKNCNVLDLGCGFGYYLNYLKSKKISSKGIEPAKNIANFCKNELKINVVSSKLDEEIDNSYDLITLFDVIEHLKNPVEYFKKINQKLKKNGYCVIYTPNIRSLSYALMGSDQNTMLPFEHICFFDENSINYLAKKTKFKVDTIETYGFDIMDYFLFREYIDKTEYIKKFEKFIDLVQSIVDKNKVSNHFRITLKKI